MPRGQRRANRGIGRATAPLDELANGLIHWKPQLRSHWVEGPKRVVYGHTIWQLLHKSNYGALIASPEGYGGAVMLDIDETRREHLLELQSVFGFQSFTMRHYPQ